MNKQLLLSHYRTGKGELIQLDAKDVYEKNFGLNPKDGFSGVRWHVGNSILWSRGCMIVGSNILREGAIPNIYKMHPSYAIPIHIFDLNDSLLKSEELSKFAYCVKCKLKKDPSVKAIYKS